MYYPFVVVFYWLGHFGTRWADVLTGIMGK